jgi:four helix bundle protein
MAHRLEELPIFSEAQRFCAAVTEILGRSRVRKNSELFGQIDEANDSILSNMDEGFEQVSDDGFARYLYYSKGCVAEVVSRTRRAGLKGDIAAEDVRRIREMSKPLGKMLGGFIKYLKRSNFKDRGRFRASQRTE